MATRMDTIKTGHRAQLDHKRADVRIRQCRVMLHLFDLAGRCQKLFKVPRPSRRILAAAQSANLRPIQDGFDTGTQSGCSLVLAQPDWLQHAQHQVRRYIGRTQRTDDGISVSGQRADPELSILVTSPFDATRLNISECALLESQRRNNLRLALRLLLFAQDRGIIAPPHDLAMRIASGSRCLNGHTGIRANLDQALTTVRLRLAELPVLMAGRPDQ